MTTIKLGHIVTCKTFQDTTRRYKVAWVWKSFQAGTHETRYEAILIPEDTSAGTYGMSAFTEDLLLLEQPHNEH